MQVFVFFQKQRAFPFVDQRGEKYTAIRSIKGNVIRIVMPPGTCPLKQARCVVLEHVFHLRCQEVMPYFVGIGFTGASICRHPIMRIHPLHIRRDRDPIWFPQTDARQTVQRNDHRYRGTIRKTRPQELLILLPGNIIFYLPRQSGVKKSIYVQMISPIEKSPTRWRQWEHPAKLWHPILLCFHSTVHFSFGSMSHSSFQSSSASPGAQSSGSRKARCGVMNR